MCLHICKTWPYPIPTFYRQHLLLFPLQLLCSVATLYFALIHFNFALALEPGQILSEKSAHRKPIATCEHIYSYPIRFLRRIFILSGLYWLPSIIHMHRLMMNFGLAYCCITKLTGKSDVSACMWAKWQHIGCVWM